MLRHWRKFRARRPSGHISLIAAMKGHELAAGLANPGLARRAGGRYALLMILPRGGTAAEVGVWRGGFSALLLEALRPRRLLLIDPWSVTHDEIPFRRQNPGPADPQEVFDAAHEHVRSHFAAEPAVEIFRAASVNVAAGLPDGCLDAAYIDGAHTYEAVSADLRAWSPKVKPGGILCGDDYSWTRDGGRTMPVKQAVDEFIRKIRPCRWAVFRKQFVIEP